MALVVYVRKSVKQKFTLTPRLASLMEDFRQMTNDCIRIGLEFEERNRGMTPSMKRLSLLAYNDLRARYRDFSQYALCAISKAAGILSARRKSMKRGHPTKRPYLFKPLLVSCYGFKFADDYASLTIHLDAKTFETIPLNIHTRTVLSSCGSSTKVRSFTLTLESLSLCIAKEVESTEEINVISAVGVDRNLSNVTVGNESLVTIYDLTKIVEMGENTRSIVGSFKRNDVRIRKKIASKYGKRKKARVGQILNRLSKEIVAKAKENKQLVVFENITGLRNLYRKGNGQGRSSRYRMNSSFPYGELKREADYKAAWDGEVPVLTLTKGETRGTTMDCPRCGERLQVASRDDEEHHRQLWCQKCKRWTDRDVVAVMNISHRGLLRFRSSKGEAVEAVNGNPKKRWSSLDREPVILRVDASKLRTKDRAILKHVQRT